MLRVEGGAAQLAGTRWVTGTLGARMGPGWHECCIRYRGSATPLLQPTGHPSARNPGAGGCAGSKGKGSTLRDSLSRVPHSLYLREVRRHRQPHNPRHSHLSEGKTGL